MENRSENIQPTAQTYAIMLLAWLRFNPDSETPLEIASAQPPSKLLNRFAALGISPTDVISDRVFTSSEEASQVIRMLSKAAVDMNMSRVVSELGQAEALGSHLSDPLDDVPEATPVTKLAEPSDEIVDENGNVLPSAAKEEVPFNLDNLRKHLGQIRLARRVLPEDVAARQKLLEESVYDVAVERLRHEAAVFDDLGLGNPGLRRADLQRWMWDWHQKLTSRLETEIAEIIAAESKKTHDRGGRLGPFLSLVKPDKLSLITILEIMRLNSTGGINDGMKTARALLTVGRAVENEYKAQMCKRNNIAIPSQLRPGDQNFFTGLGYRDLHARRVTAAKYMEDSEEWTTEWTQLLRVRMGSILVDCLMDVATVGRTAIDKRTGEEVKEQQPAFYHAYEYVRGQKLGVIRLNPVVADRLAKDGLRETLHPRHLPMLVKPKPWLGPDQGGYLYNNSAAMRFKDCQEQQSYLEHASSLGNVELVYAGLDVLGSTPWNINRKIFDVVLKVWNSGERLCKIPPAVYDKPQPEKPANYDTDVKTKSTYGQRLKTYTQDKANNHSERCSVNYKIEISRAFLGDTFYLPHNLDFRGRAYPIPPHLNHIGDDLSRGLLMFAEAKPLGERGLRWLKIHLANLYGFDKGSFDERVEFVMKRLDDIYDSAEKPLEGRRWWTTADDPWQCLATCMDLRAALESGDPHAHLSNLPVHQDGTCNGLQHYAALGGDGQGAAQVNLAVTDRPSDVYTFVANMVEEIVKRDVAAGDKVAQIVSGKISRKVVKQTVMTTVYGVTYVGAREQIEKQLRDRGDISEEECWIASSYLAKNVLSCIGDLFSGAKAIQNWLNLCAKLISKSIPEDRLAEAIKPEQPTRGKRTPMCNRIRKEQMATVVWTTPLGLPIVQPYRKTKRKQITTALQTVYISDPNAPAEVNGAKQASAFPPNFIHSLDATHMMLTALECRTQGLTFASVHDSYWTHASDIDKMSEIIRDTFIALHSSDVLGKLALEFRERYANHMVPLSAIRTARMLKNLRTAGSRIIASKDQAAELNEKGVALGNLLDITDQETSSFSIAPDVDVAEDKSEIVLRGRGRPRGPNTQEKEEHDEDEDAEEVDLHGPFANKFVKLAALIPPLPQKGDFKVETIKKSLYFFS
ncbi:DNA/RNA polymerase [Paxillus ammoniavirescens]|nr:DNA/RNA polymerase [Paxillus ammoniavirescens]